MNRNELARIAQAMVAKGKGMLAADESTGTIKKRFDAIRLESTEEHRRTYRELLLHGPGGAGVDQRRHPLRRDHPAEDRATACRFPQYLTQQGMIPGIKVDLGAKPLAGFPGETITEGLDGLRERLIEYHSLGRALREVACGHRHRRRHSERHSAIEANAQALARYAALCQENDIVPIVEPEVLMDGGHSIERCEEVTNATLQAVFDQLLAHRIYLEGMVLKPNMVISGKKAANRALARGGGRGDPADA